MDKALSLLVLALACSGLQAEAKRTEDVIYGRKFGTVLTRDFVQP